MRRLLPLAILIGLGCGTTEPSESSTSTAGASKADAKAAPGRPPQGAKAAVDAKALLAAKPIDRKAFSDAVLYRTTRELADLLGPPARVIPGEMNAGPEWEYPVPGERGVRLLIHDDRVFGVDWGPY